MEMENESKGLNPRTWNAISLGALLIAVAFGLILYWATSDLLTTFGVILLVFGVYVAATSSARKGGENNFGPSTADATLASGVVVAAIGAACLIYSTTDEVLITVAVLIIAIAAIGIIMAVKNRNE